MPKLAVGELELNYERAGSGEPLLLIQGMSANHKAWGDPFRSRLEEAFEVTVFDNRGMGLSSPVEGSFTIADMAADTAALMTALELESAHVLGISMGGMIAQELALAHPERIRSLTLGCTYCGGEGSALMNPSDFRGLVEAMRSRDPDRVFRETYKLNLSPGFREDEANYEPFAAMAAALPAPAETIGVQLQAIMAHDTHDRLAEIAAPTLVVHGTADRMLGVVNGHLIASLIPGSRLEIFDDVGHLFWWEQPERAAELIREHALAAV
jgi:pimeloyl-ACP methyl ester carboxylesterase